MSGVFGLGGQETVGGSDDTGEIGIMSAFFEMVMELEDVEEGRHEFQATAIQRPTLQYRDEVVLFELNIVGPIFGGRVTGGSFFNDQHPQRELPES